MKSPYEKAKELIDFYVAEIYSVTFRGYQYSQATEMAIIEVDETLKKTPKTEEGVSLKKYWEEVKVELIKQRK